MNKKILKDLDFKVQVLAVENKICPICYANINMDEFRDKLSLKEYHISGMCQSCQDKIFDNKQTK